MSFIFHLLEEYLSYWIITHDIILIWLHLQKHYFTNTVTFSQMPGVRISLHFFPRGGGRGGRHNLTHDRNLRQTKSGSSWEGPESEPWRLQSKEHHPTTSWWWASLMWAKFSNGKNLKLNTWNFFCQNGGDFWTVSSSHESESHSVVSDSLWPHGLYSPWNSPGQKTGVGSLSLL